MANLLAGKFGIVTGGGSGIGRAICIGLAEQGAHLLVVDKFPKAAEDVAKALPAVAGGKHSSFGCDVAHSNEVNAMVEFAMKEYNAVPEIVVNCAGIIRDAPLLDMTEQQFDEVVAVNLKGVYLVTQAFAKLAIKHKTQQSVINIASILGKVGAAERANYASTKSAVIGFTKSAASAWARDGIRVNAVLPGYITTPLTAAIEDKLLKAACEKIPMGRMGEPKEIADACVFLASNWSSYVTGSAMEVTGGFGM